MQGRFKRIGLRSEVDPSYAVYYEVVYKAEKRQNNFVLNCVNKSRCIQTGMLYSVPLLITAEFILQTMWHILSR